jgi:hypothetical protein
VAIAVAARLCAIPPISRPVCGPGTWLCSMWPVLPWATCCNLQAGQGQTHRGSCLHPPPLPLATRGRGVAEAPPLAARTQFCALHRAVGSSRTKGSVHPCCPARCCTCHVHLPSSGPRFSGVCVLVCCVRLSRQSVCGAWPDACCYPAAAVRCRWEVMPCSCI